MKKKQPIINTHVHIFTGDHVPNYIAKKIIPWPLYYFTHLGFWVWFYKKFKKDHRRNLKFLRDRDTLIGYIKSSWILSILFSTIIGLLLINAVYFLLAFFDVVSRVLPFIPNPLEPHIKEYLLFTNLSDQSRICLIIIVSLFSGNARKSIWFILKKLVKPLSFLRKEQLEFGKRYLDILEFVKYQSQTGIFNRLEKMYPSDSKLVVLPMDMEYMGAGKTNEPYLQQLKDLYTAVSDKNKAYHKKLIPFVFVDPRRITDKNGTKFFSWKNVKGKVSLNDCLLKKYLHGKNAPFKGIKIYPALGYFPFDKNLLPLWLYCCQNNIPITTHCTYGTMYYRGKMNRKWFKHPVFKDADYKPLSIVPPKNRQLQVNFTHPLNYLVLLDTKFLHQYLMNLKDISLNELFGLSDKTISRNLKNLKINFAHYGGSEEWIKFLKEDRNDPTLKITDNPGYGLDFTKSSTNPPTNLLSKPAWFWDNQNIDWYSIITTLMWQYPNVYADISYVLHNTSLTPLINMTMQDSMLREKLLFGTDFYVVRNHKSEKDLLAELLYGLSEQDFDQMARTNPAAFLRNSF